MVEADEGRHAATAETMLGLALALGILAAAPLAAQDSVGTLIVTRNVNLRRTPSTAIAEIRLLRPPDELVPEQTRPLPGDPTRGLRLLDWRLDHGRFTATVEGSGEQRFRVRSALPLTALSGGRIERRDADFITIVTPLSATGERRDVVLAGR